MVKEFYHSGQCFGCCVRCTTLIRLGHRLRLYYGVEKDLETMSEKHEMLVVGSELNSLPYLAGFQIMSQDMVKE